MVPVQAEELERVLAALTNTETEKLLVIVVVIGLFVALGSLLALSKLTGSIQSMAQTLNKKVEADAIQTVRIADLSKVIENLALKEEERTELARETLSEIKKIESISVTVESSFKQALSQIEKTIRESGAENAELILKAIDGILFRLNQIETDAHASINRAIENGIKVSDAVDAAKREIVEIFVKAIETLNKPKEISDDNRNTVDSSD